MRQILLIEKKPKTKQTYRADSFAFVFILICLVEDSAAGLAGRIVVTHFWVGIAAVTGVETMLFAGIDEV